MEELHQHISKNNLTESAMSELFTQNYSDKPLFHTDTDISESLHNQVDEASNGEELLDSTEKQTESLLSNDDYVRLAE